MKHIISALWESESDLDPALRLKVCRYRTLSPSERGTPTNKHKQQPKQENGENLPSEGDWFQVRNCDDRREQHTGANGQHDGPAA